MIHQKTSKNPENIRSLYNRGDEKLTLFVGSGISVSSPTELPTGYEITNSLLGLDWVKGDERFPYPEEKINSSAVSSIRFEHLLSIFCEWRRHDVGSIMDSHKYLDNVPLLSR